MSGRLASAHAHTPSSPVRRFAVISASNTFIAAVREAMALIDKFETNGIDPSGFVNPRQKFAHIRKIRPWSLNISGDAAAPLVTAIPGVDDRGRALVAMTSENKAGETIAYRHETRVRALVWYTAGERRAFTETIQNCPQVASASVRAAREAFAKAMAQARAWDRAATGALGPARGGAN
jgi:hypothetical protein